MLLAGWRLQRLLAKHNFNPGQPRVPAGDPDGGQWTSGGSDSAWRRFPRKVSRHRSIISKTPADAVLYKTSDGTPFVAPPNADFKKIYEAGQNISNIPVSEQLDYIRANIAQDGVFDFQRTP